LPDIKFGGPRGRWRRSSSTRIREPGVVDLDLAVNRILKFVGALVVQSVSAVREVVVPAGIRQHVGLVATEELVRTVSAVEHVEILTSEDGVVAVVSVDKVFSLTARHAVIPRPAVQAVGGWAAVDDVIACATDEFIESESTSQYIVPT
jgi:hypothetical protein